MMIVSPIKEVHPNLFKSIPKVDELIAKVSESVMCNALVHYASMLDTASTELLNSILRISALIVQRIVNENNRGSLGKIYQQALNNLLNCEHAITFVRVIGQYESGVATKSVYEFYDWDRSLDGVVRRLAGVMIDDETIVTVTDCSTLESVYNLLTCDVVPKILPFRAQSELLEGMMRISRQADKKRPGVRSSIHDLSSSKSATLFIEAGIFECDFAPLPMPSEVKIDEEEFRKKWQAELVMSTGEFLRADI
jgi:hypothetical protein